MVSLLRATPKTSDLAAEAGIPCVPWSEIQSEVVYGFDPGEHMFVLGKTGTGKTTMVLRMLEEMIRVRNSNVVAFGTKPRDSTLKKIGWPIIHDWPPTFEQRQTHHVVLWPPYTKPSRAKATTGPVIADALDAIILEGGWRVFVDEMAYLVETLGLRAVLDEYYNGARASEISLIGATQRPAWLPRSAVSQVDWVVCFKLNDTEDQKRAAEILGDRQRFAPVIKALSKERHEFLIVRDDAAVLSWVD